jgi:hypothetical protein
MTFWRGTTPARGSACCTFRSTGRRMRAQLNRRTRLHARGTQCWAEGEPMTHELWAMQNDGQVQVQQFLRATKARTAEASVSSAKNNIWALSGSSFECIFMVKPCPSPKCHPACLRQRIIRRSRVFSPTDRRLRLTRSNRMILSVLDFSRGTVAA